MNTPYEWVIITSMSLLAASITRYLVNKEKRNKLDAIVGSSIISIFIMFATLVFCVINTIDLNAFISVVGLVGVVVLYFVVVLTKFNTPTAKKSFDNELKTKWESALNSVTNKLYNDPTNEKLLVEYHKLIELEPKKKYFFTANSKQDGMKN